jgi:small subunit ribosomal protein S2
MLVINYMSLLSIKDRLSILSLESFQNAGSQFGHSTRDWRPSILGVNNFAYRRNEFLVFNLKNSFFFLQKAYLFLKKMAYKDSIFLYVDSTGVSNLAVKNAALFANIPYVANLWAGGTLTNFREVVYKVSRKARNSELRTKTMKYMSGVYQLDFVPEVIVSSSEFYSPFAVSESNLLSIPSIAVADSNIFSLESAYPVLLNDDSFLSTKMLFFVFSSSYWFGKADFSVRYFGITNAVIYRSVASSLIVGISIIKKSLKRRRPLRKWLRKVRERYYSLSILRMISVVGLEPTFSFTRSGF